jgi:hypothetical protein
VLSALRGGRAGRIQANSRLTIIGKDTFRLVQRYSASLAQSSTPLPASVLTTVAGAFTLPGITALQAMRVIQGHVRLSSQAPNPTNNTSIIALAPFIFMATLGNAILIRGWGAPSANIEIGPTGMILNIPDSDFILGSDFAESGGVSSSANIFLTAQSDVMNTTAGALAAGWNGSVSVEVYQIDNVSN